MKARVIFLLAVIATAHGWHRDAVAAEGLREAKVHADRALRQYNLGNFEDAIAEFSKAYEIDPSPIFLFNIGQSHRHIGNLDRAIFFFKRYLNETGPDAPSRDEAQQNIRELEERIAGQKIAREKTTAPAPAPTKAAPSSSPPAPPAPVVPAPPQNSIAAGKPIPAMPPVSEQAVPLNRTLAWIAGGAALVALGTGVAFHVGASGQFSDFDRSCVLVPGTNQPVPDPNKPGRTQSQCASFYNSWRSDRRWAIAGYATAGALALTSTILFLTSRSESPHSGTRMTLRCRVGVDGILCGGAF